LFGRRVVIFLVGAVVIFLVFVLDVLVHGRRCAGLFSPHGLLSVLVVGSQLLDRTVHFTL